MTQMFDQYGPIVSLATDRGTEIPTIPAAVYLIQFHPARGFYLKQQAVLVRPEKLYSNTSERAAKILKTYLDRPNANTGVLFTGNKGSGKTLITKEVAMQSVEMDIPVLICDEPYTGSQFFQFLNAITQRCVVLIDEFEKKYDDDEKQNSLLSLLDGTGTGGKLYLLTSNAPRVSEFLTSRPSRIFYHYRYDKLDEETLVGYCQDNLKDQGQLENMRTLHSLSTDFSFDVMQCLVEELNRYPDVAFAQSLTELNITITGLMDRHYKLEHVKVNGEDLSVGDMQRINLLTVSDGKDVIMGRCNIEDWNLQKALYQAVGKNNCNFYNLDLLQMEQSGEEIDTDDVDSDFSFRLTYAPEDTRANTEIVEVRRTFGDYEVEILFKAVKVSQQQDFYNRLFK